MHYRTVSAMDGVSFSEIGLGCWAFSGDFVWDGYQETASLSTIHRALDLGVNFFDVAPVYGFGEAERLLGAALKGLDRSSFTIASKCGLVRDDVKRIKTICLRKASARKWRSACEGCRPTSSTCIRCIGPIRSRQSKTRWTP